jgi:hypothetical protein
MTLPTPERAKPTAGAQKAAQAFAAAITINLPICQLLANCVHHILMKRLPIGIAAGHGNETSVVPIKREQAVASGLR